jgi:hypothetical protein
MEPCNDHGKTSNNVKGKQYNGDGCCPSAHGEEKQPGRRIGTSQSCTCIYRDNCLFSNDAEKAMRQGCQHLSKSKDDHEQCYESDTCWTIPIH